MKTIGGKIIYSFLLLVLPVCSLNCSAQGSFAGSHLSKFIGISDGLPSNFVDDIMFDDAGFMWVATSGGGLCRYDGYEFIVMATGMEYELKSNFVRNVVEDGFHRLWIGTEWGIEVFDLMNSCMVSVPGTQGTAFDLFEGGSCSYMTLDSKGCIWAKTGQTLMRIEFDDTGNALRVDSLGDPRMAQPAMVFKDVEKNGTVWIGMNGTIYRVRSTDDGLTFVPALPGFGYNPESLVTDYIVKDQDVWISTIDGLFRYNLPTGLWKLYATDPGNDKSLSQNYISGLALTSDNTLVALSLKGANFYRPIDDSFERLSSDSDVDGCSLSSNFLNCVSVRGDDVWFGTESAGLVQLKTKRLAVSNYRHQSSDAASIASNPVNAIYQTRDGMLWVGSVESGLSYTMDPKEGFRHITAKDGGISHNSVSAVTSDDKGNLWVGTWGGGVDVLSGVSPYVRVQKLMWKGAQSDRIDH
ncbi:MAG: hybrid sensor histidine kinase/response regulator, partial [Bacteroidaceae bacterium]|nr:hybrid sensor histidine kinase/response regulator [Bacteroidaceae bacterium]